MWKNDLVEWASRLKHPAWGASHSRRVYELALEIAGEKRASLDEGAVFAAAYVHDAGAFEPYKRTRIDHAERSAEVAAEILIPLGFPEERLPLVQDIIRGHMFNAEPVRRLEAVAFHDADTLEFLGAVGIARLLSITRIDDWAPDLGTAVSLIERFAAELPSRLYSPAAQRIGKTRQREMEDYLAALSAETGGLRVL